MMRWTVAPDGVPIETGIVLPERIEYQGRIYVGVPEWRLPDFGWYPEVRDPLPPYSDGYSALPVIEGDEAIYHPIVPSDAIRLQRALDALDQRIATERDRRVAIATTGLELDDMVDHGVERKQREALMQAQALARREYLGIATQDEIDTIEMMSGVPDQVYAISIQQAAISQWARAHLATWQAADAFDPKTPPQEAPQWPE